MFASNLLEHFRSPEDVARFLERMRETLAPGGVLALMGPNFKYCADEYFDCADHLLALTHVSVQELLFAAGYRREGSRAAVPAVLVPQPAARVAGAHPAVPSHTRRCGASRASSS